MGDSTLNLALCAAVLIVPLVPYLVRTRRREAAARLAAERAGLHSEGPAAQHPAIRTDLCIGCGSCTRACPEGDVLAVVGGKAVIVNGHKCIGHGVCADACPVGAITIVMAKPSVTADMPRLTSEYETSVPGIFVAGELGGLALIKNAVSQGRACIDTIAARRAGAVARTDGVLDVAIVGAGPAGITAALRAVELKLSYVVLEQDEFGGTVAKYPRRKLVMTSPVELPMYGRFRKLEISKENLLALWLKLARETQLAVRDKERVDDIRRDADGAFTLTTTNGTLRARHVILGLGRRGTPRRLGIPGEELPKVMYALIEADHYVNAKILVVGGGDSAVEAAMGLAEQKGNSVTLSYRQATFSRIKERNAVRIADFAKRGKLELLMESAPVEVREDAVVLDVRGEKRTLPNDHVWVFAGGTPPSAFLSKVGIATGTCDLTEEAAAAAREIRLVELARAAEPQRAVAVGGAPQAIAPKEVPA